MHYIVLIFFIIYFITIIDFSFNFFRKNKTNEDIYLGGCGDCKWHIGLSVVATNVGGGFATGRGIMALVYRFKG